MWKNVSFLIHCYCVTHSENHCSCGSTKFHRTSKVAWMALLSYCTLFTIVSLEKGPNRICGVCTCAVCMQSMTLTDFQWTHINIVCCIWEWNKWVLAGIWVLICWWFIWNVSILLSVKRKEWRSFQCNSMTLILNWSSNYAKTHLTNRIRFSSNKYYKYLLIWPRFSSRKLSYLQTKQKQGKKKKKKIDIKHESQTDKQLGDILSQWIYWILGFNFSSLRSVFIRTTQAFTGRRKWN